MKKILLFLVLIFPINVFAKEITLYERTEENLRINESVNLDTVNVQEVLNTPSVDENQKVYDFADILTDSEEENLYSYINSYIEAYKNDYVIVTIKENKTCFYEENNECSKKYVDNFYKYNNFNKDGVLLLIDLNNKNDILYIYNSGNTSSIFTSKNIKDIMDYSYKYFNSNEYYEGLKDIIYTMSSYYNKDLSFYNETQVTTVKETNKYFINFVLSFLISLIVGIIFVAINYNKSKSNKSDFNDTYIKNNGVNKVNDILVSENDVVSDLDLFDDYNIKGDIL